MYLCTLAINYDYSNQQLTLCISLSYCGNRSTTEQSAQLTE